MKQNQTIPFYGPDGTSLGYRTPQAAERLFGCEISPSYCDVILRRIANLSGDVPVLLASGQEITALAAERGVTLDQLDNPRARDARRIQHHGPAPFYGSRRKAS